MQVLLIGAGRYGNDLIGRKYLSGKLPVKLAGVVDTNIDKIKQSANYALKNTPTYHCLEEVPKKVVRESICEIALIPQILPEVYGRLVNIGARKIILPKPVAITTKDYNEVENITKKNNVKALIASNWHYSKITKILKTFIDNILNSKNEAIDETDIQSLLNFSKSHFSIKKVDIEYSKKDEVLTIDPPMQELPHALQIVYSTGLSNLKEIQCVVKNMLQSKSRVNINLVNTKNIKNGININSDLKAGDTLKTSRKRIVKIYLNNTEGKNALLTADYDAKFKNEICTKYPVISFQILNSGSKPMTCTIKEDNMNTMYEQIFKNFSGENNNSLTIKKYGPISNMLCEIQEKWKEIISQNK